MKEWALIAIGAVIVCVVDHALAGDRERAVERVDGAIAQLQVAARELDAAVLRFRERIVDVADAVAARG